MSEERDFRKELKDNDWIDEDGNHQEVIYDYDGHNPFWVDDLIKAYEDRGDEIDRLRSEWDFLNTLQDKTAEEVVTLRARVKELKEQLDDETSPIRCGKCFKSWERCICPKKKEGE